jgi:outer membrane protein TolC
MRLIEESLAARPELAKAEAIVRAEQERVPQAGALPDPMLQVGLQNDGFTSIEIGRMGTSYVSLMAQQTLPWPGRRALRRQVAAYGSVEAATQVTRARLSAEADVRRAYLDLLLARDRLVLQGRLEAIWRQSGEVARILYEAGKGPQSDVLRADLELRRLDHRRAELKGDEKLRVLNLNRLRHHPLDEPLETWAHVRDLAPPASQSGRFSPERAVEQSPELLAARYEIARAAKATELAENGHYPDVTVGAGLMVRGQLPPMWLVTVAAPVPLWAGEKQSRAVAEGRAWEQVARKEVEALAQGVRLRSEERRAAFATLVHTLEVYDGGLLLQSEATAESTLNQYKIGAVGFASVLDANAGLIADHEGYLQAVAAAHRVLVDEAEVSLSPGAMSAAGAAAAPSIPGARSGAGGGAAPSM